MVVLGYDDTLSVTVDDIAHHTAAVARGLKASTADVRLPMVVADLPWMSYHTDTHDAVRNAAALIRAGRSEEHTSDLPSLMRISYAVLCLKKKNTNNTRHKTE